MSAKRDTEQVILDAARKVFVEMGPQKARMQDIAEEADITQSLLHYYYRRRDDLYEAVFEEEVQRVIPRKAEILQSDRPLPEKLGAFARSVIDFHAQNPHLAAFVALETHYNDAHTERIKTALEAIDLDALQAQIDQRAEAGKMEPMDAKHLLVHVFSLSLFPFIAAPIFQSLYEMDDDAFAEFIEERKAEVPRFIDQALTRCGDTSPSA